MKKNSLFFMCLFFVAMVMCSCESNSVPKAYIGKWDMTNDKESNLQKVIEFKEGSTFEETWTLYDDNGEQIAELVIQGHCELIPTKGGYAQNSLCLVYDLESLSDPEGILEAFDNEDYFKDENESYESAKNKGEVYGYQNIHISGSTIRFKNGKWNLIDEAMNKLFEESN